MPSVNRACPVCQTRNPIPVYNNTMAPIGGLDMSYEIGRCTKCGFHFAHVLPDDITFRSYYQSVSKYDVVGKISKLDQLRIDAAVKILEGKVPHDAMIVDLGCGYGALLSCLKQAGWNNLHGVDPAPKSADRARELFDLGNIHCGTMAEAHQVFPLEKADLVCVMAVLEHLPNLRDDLSDLLKKLRIGCKILVEVPAIECFAGSISEPFGEFSLEHIQYFSSTSLMNLFISLGATAMAIDIFNIKIVESGDIFILFEYTGESNLYKNFTLEDPAQMERYISDSTCRLETALTRIPDSELIIYGAGSHTARLLPYLDKMIGKKIIAVVDSNPNLSGKNIGRWVIQSPNIIESLPDVPILVSSYRSQNEIATDLRNRIPNPLVLLYE